MLCILSPLPPFLLILPAKCAAWRLLCYCPSAVAEPACIELRLAMAWLTPQRVLSSKSRLLLRWAATVLFMVALCNRADHIYFHPVVSFYLLSFFYSSPNLSRRRLDVCHTSTHSVALVRI